MSKARTHHRLTAANSPQLRIMRQMFNDKIYALILPAMNSGGLDAALAVAGRYLNASGRASLTTACEEGYMDTLMEIVTRKKRRL